MDFKGILLQRGDTMNLALERRCGVRKPVNLEVFLRSSQEPVGIAKNLSLGGMFVEGKNQMSPGTKALLEFRLPAESLPIKAYSEVVWTKKEPESTGMGIRFINLYDLDRKRLQRFYEGLDCELVINSDDYTLFDFLKVSGKDLFDKTRPVWAWIEDMKKKGFYTYRRPLLSESGNRAIVFDDVTGKEREMIMMGSNNYLGLATHPKVIKAARDAAEKYGVGAVSAPMLAGTFDVHKKLEATLARLKGCEDAVVFSSGYSTNVGCISALVREGDLAVIDRLAHASIIDGCTMSSGKFRTFKHSDMVSLREVLERNKDICEGKLIVVDGIYSMDGDIAPLPEIMEVAREYGARVMVDDAHATGVIGDRGRGTASHFKMEGKVDIVMGTLSKSLGQLGGFIASSKEVINYLRCFARSYFFATSLSPVLAAGALAAIEVMENEPERIQKLWENIRYFKENLKHMGFNIVENSESAIIPIIIGDELLLRRMGKRVHEEGLFINPIPYPAVPRNQTRFRATVMATHTREDLDTALEILEKVGREFSLIGPGASRAKRVA
jgi:glycine C-acetyltransferase